MLPSCSTACNECNDQQKSGLDFSKAPPGSSSFGGLNLGGCALGTWGGGKRDFIPRGSSEKRNYAGLGGMPGGGGQQKSSGPSPGGVCLVVSRANDHSTDQHP